MKIFWLLVFLIPFVSDAQTVGDYETAMTKFQKFYNAGQGDSINAMFFNYSNGSRTLWDNEFAKSAIERYGSLETFTFLGIDTSDNDVYVFQTIFSKAGSVTTSLTLYEGNKLGTFRLITSSEGIDELLKKNSANR